MLERRGVDDTSRKVKEWVGTSPDTPVPPRVKLRVLTRSGYACSACRRAITTGDRWSCDHVVALVNGGENRESNLAPLCAWCRPVKDAADVASKSVVAKARLQHYGIKLRSQFRPLAGTKRSGWKKRMDGRVERR